MKKLIPLAILAITMFSCTNEDEKSTNKDIQLADATLNIKTEESNITGKDVERGSLHAWIKDINVHATNMELIHNKDYSFTLVANNTPGADHDFVMTGLAIGRNDFSIVTTTNTLPELISTRSDVNPEIYMRLTSAKNPYAVYSATTSANITYGQNNSITPTILRTKNGRHIALFKLSDELAALGIRATVTPIINGVTKRELEFTTELLGRVYWSDADCVAGKTIKYSVKLLKPNGDPVMD